MSILQASSLQPKARDCRPGPRWYDWLPATQRGLGMEFAHIRLPLTIAKIDFSYFIIARAFCPFARFHSNIEQLTTDCQLSFQTKYTPLITFLA